MRKRKDILNDLVLFKGNLLDLQKELFKYSWDLQTPIITISKLDFVNILKRGIVDNISFEEIVNWANIIECRDDLNFEVSEIQEIIFELANPEINGDITKERLQEIIDGLK